MNLLVTQDDIQLYVVIIMINYFILIFKNFRQKTARVWKCFLNIWFIKLCFLFFLEENFLKYFVIITSFYIYEFWLIFLFFSIFCCFRICYFQDVGWVNNPSCALIIIVLDCWKKVLFIPILIRRRLLMRIHIIFDGLTYIKLRKIVFAEWSK